MSTTLEQLQYGFDRASRRTWQRRVLTDTQDQSYNYDALSQVSHAARGSLNLNTTAISGIPASAESWDYDPTGNWRGYHAAANGAATLDQQRVHDRGNRLTQIEDNPNNMILDRVGRMRQAAPDASGDWDGKLEITWDAWSRVTSVKDNGEVVGEYTYDGQHRRVTREVGGETLHSYYNNQWRPVEERKDAEATAALSYLWGARHRDDLVRRDRAVDGTTLNETRYVLMDYFNPAALTDEAGEVMERYAYSAFGVRTVLNVDFTVRSTSECGMEFAFQGQFLDVESGLMNYGYRYYSPMLGRWVSKDPIQEKGGLNLYVLTSNSPVNQTDFLGLDDGPSNYEMGGCSTIAPGMLMMNYMFGHAPSMSGGRRTGSENDTMDITPSGAFSEAVEWFEYEWLETIEGQIIKKAEQTTANNCCVHDTAQFDYNDSAQTTAPIESFGPRFALQTFTVDWKITCDVLITVKNRSIKQCSGDYDCTGSFTLKDTFDFGGDSPLEKIAGCILGSLGKPFKVTGHWYRDFSGNVF